jgi:type I restriction enzyme S subunit
MSRYTYKESGIEWLGEVPHHWEAKKVKRIAYLQYGDNLPQDDRNEGGIPVYGSNGIVGTHNENNAVGNTIIVGRKGSAGALNFSPSGTFVIDTAFYIDENNSRCNVKWLYYLLQQLNLTHLEQESPVPGLNRGQVHYKKIPVPTVPEQKAIAEYLDTTCKKINQVIAKKKKQIEILKQNKKSKTFENVTTGLNPHVDFRNVKSEWLKQIPKNWQERKVKRIAYLQYGDNLPQDDRNEGEIPVYGSNGIVGTHNENNTVGNTIIVGRKGSAGALNFSPSGTFVIDTAFYIDENNSRCNIKWLYYLLQQLNLTHLEQESPVPGLNRNQVLYKTIPIPPKIEQDEIAMKLDHTVEKFMDLENKISNQIEKLIKYKKSLIYECVTGKKQVYEGSIELPTENALTVNSA